tara:strand:+ start:220 stop:561 length:342 start_codon:yes stop_codon:yes gene_type:complete
LFIFLKINKMTNNIKKNLFRLEEEEFDRIEEEEDPIIKNQKTAKKIELYPVKENKKKNSKIKTSKKPNSLQDSSVKEKINITASDYPGEVVKHSEHYFISLRDGDSFSWFLLK